MPAAHGLRLRCQTAGQIVEQTFWDAGEHFDGSAEDTSEVSASP
jgi:hypothetical protein